MFFCSKAIKKEKFIEEKEVPKPKKSPSPISIDTDDNIDMATPWLSAGKPSVSANGTNNNKSQSDDEQGATLIVCPLSVLSNWTVSVASTLTINSPHLFFFKLHHHSSGLEQKFNSICYRTSNSKLLLALGKVYFFVILVVGKHAQT